MSLAKKIVLGALVYIGYQILTNKKYNGLCKQIVKEFKENKFTVIKVLDDVHTYLSVPKDIGDETVKIKIDTEIKLLKQKIMNMDAEKIASQTNKIITTVADSISNSLTSTKKRK
ncbi:MAG: hypothetical protein LBP70_03520 [Mycoplasmataceae bacterium]|jgi:hypothetical protein|nr:hypothetical protein [Mycoplasmataceae bacterium]